MRGPLAGLAALLLLLAGCGNDSTTATDTSSATSSATTSSTSSGSAGACPTGGDAVSWPDGVPSDIPLVAGSEIQSTDKQDTVTYVRFLVPMSFKDAVTYYLAELPKAGFTLATGDSEAAEADIPFSRDTDQFSLKLSGLSDPCHTQGVLGVGASADPDEDGDSDQDSDSPDADAS